MSLLLPAANGCSMRLYRFLPLMFGVALTGCDKGQSVDASPAEKRAEVVAASSTATASNTNDVLKSPKPIATAAEAKPAPTGPYRVLGILDPDRERMVAFALKVPGDWRAQQEFKRRWEGAVGQPQVFLTLRSPDGRSQIEYWPSAQYVHGEGPMSGNLREQRRAMGLSPQTAPNDVAPMSPTAYIRQVVLPELARRGQALSDIGNEQTAPKTSGENGQTNLRGSVDGKLPNGNRARVECRITHVSRQLGSDLYHSWSVVPSITQTAGDLEAIHTHTRVAQDSIVPNPAWLQLEQQAQSRGMQANSEASRRQHEATMGQIQANREAMTRAHEQRMNDIRSFGEANTARFNERMGQMDRDQRVRVDTIRGETRYADPTTGERVKVEDGNNHVYRSRENPNIYLGTDTPIDAGKVNWQELQKVQLKDY